MVTWIVCDHLENNLIINQLAIVDAVVIIYLFIWNTIPMFLPSVGSIQPLTGYKYYNHCHRNVWPHYKNEQ